MDFSQLNSAEQAHMTKIIEKKQMQDFLRLYSGLVERCFSSCCNDFTSKALSSKEEQCVMNCADKFLKHSERVGQRFAELNAEAMGPKP
ncbi:Tim10/DDP family zinc finger protein [Suillus subaureus]|uniref:Mitochondrial import inner membrane translocase subunit n=3 Tax=Suillus TaxID=5379 RepID=A0A9P7JHH7_9AGAM|nr:Tim10/DDP family zinc finger protein [Suillus subaureus]XP_041211215.1 Tim10/DDP family zinc finger protein [Suillus clintonianus]XP_041239148.1 Tim10/DDP family zinc finger protein [Suillus subalutaceus]KAG1729936.1 Tim10/DDP family zinc finger protein [Suillus lakei]KAG1765928.1 Tim10/DDP family zinc finger protein [Suillus occidentalis]KAG1776205.1 Tim10/DDP family zinc finger protein [Suillus placidus]KAG1879151.1 Tim10/DDP family zinc finger protein [Suillus subluteus]KAG2030375.1 Ti